MTVPQVREAFEHLVFDENDKNKIPKGGWDIISNKLASK